MPLIGWQEGQLSCKIFFQQFPRVLLRDKLKFKPVLWRRYENKMRHYCVILCVSMVLPLTSIFPNVCHIHVFVSKQLNISTNLFPLSPSTVPQCHRDPSAGEQKWVQRLRKICRFQPVFRYVLQFDQQWSNLAWYPIQRRGMFVWVRNMPGDGAPILEVPVLTSIPFHVEWTKFAVVTHWDGCVFMGQLCHCILLKCVAWFVNNVWTSYLTFFTCDECV